MPTDDPKRAERVPMPGQVWERNGGRSIKYRGRRVRVSLVTDRYVWGIWVGSGYESHSWRRATFLHQFDPVPEVDHG